MLITDEELKEVLDILDKTYPDARPELDHTSPFEMLIATILSAQCTDVRVNMVTKELFTKFNDSEIDKISLKESRLLCAVLLLYWACLDYKFKYYSIKPIVCNHR